jgi:hypothetical protein
MFTALVLACSIDFKECKSFSSGTIFLDESNCLNDVSLGIASIESGGWLVVDWKCYHWDTVAQNS